MSAHSPGMSRGHQLRPRNDFFAITSEWSWLTKKLSFRLGRSAWWTVEAPCTEAFSGK
jgi:hypothetical protein